MLALTNAPEDVELLLSHLLDVAEDEKQVLVQAKEAGGFNVEMQSNKWFIDNTRYVFLVPAFHKDFFKKLHACLFEKGVFHLCCKNILFVFCFGSCFTAFTFIMATSVSHCNFKIITTRLHRPILSLPFFIGFLKTTFCGCTTRSAFQKTLFWTTGPSFPPLKRLSSPCAA